MHGVWYSTIDQILFAIMFAVVFWWFFKNLGFAKNLDMVSTVGQQATGRPLPLSSPCFL